jgi:uncharacterized secreted repeat protein (TIGR03808 family)
MISNRRTLIASALGLAATATVAQAGPREIAEKSRSVGASGLIPGSPLDQTQALQSAINAAARAGRPLDLPPGVFRIGTLTLRPGTVITGVAGATVLEASGLSGGPLIVARGCERLHLSHLIIDGVRAATALSEDGGLIDLRDCKGVTLASVTVRRSLANGIALNHCSGRISDCTIEDALLAGVRSLDAEGLDLSHNLIRDCANNGILVWRSSHGEDGTQVTANRIERIAAKGGGTGENGNGVNVFRAGGVMVQNNRITDCAYSAVRGNAASNLQIIANSCARLGEVALYAEFGFEGAVIANNLVDTAAAGISVTNFNEGGRLAVVEGNLIRNLFRREHEPVDKRGEGIGVEADSIVSGNVIENAPTCGITIGWGPYMRSCLVANNIVREAGAGILITSDPAAGSCLISANMLADVRNGAIRQMQLGALHGPDLIAAASVNSRITISGNMAV